MRSFILVVLIFFSFSTFSQQGKYEVKGYPTDAEVPLPFLKKDKSGKVIYDSRVFGSPKFNPGYFISINGEKLSGLIAMFNKSLDWSFVKRAFLFVPEGEDAAQFISAGTAIEIFHEGKKEPSYYDYYDGIYLQRLVSGKLRLSYNPAANTSRKIGNFVSQAFIDSLRKDMVERSIEKDLKNGKSIEESLAKAKLKADLTDAFSEIEVVEKEYLLFVEETSKTYRITKDNYEEVVNKVVKPCTGLSAKDISKYASKYNKIVDLFQDHRVNCL